jgi:curli biogenesis system outer membrane secretion channel CsgG
MRTALIVAAAVAFTTLAPAFGAGVAQAQARPRVAVIAFKNPTSWWGRELGASAASQLTTKLVQGGAFTILERDRVKDIFDEWYLAQSGAVDQSKAAEMGKLNGVDYLITGEFRSFNIRQRRIGGLPLPGVARNLGGSQTRAESALNVRVISVTTGEILAAAEAKGDTVLGNGVNAGRFNYSEISTSSPWNPTIAEEALVDAIEKIAADLTSQRSKFPAAAETSSSTAPAVSSVPAIAGVAADGSIYIDQGQNAGMTVGKRFHVLRVVDIIKDAKGNELDKVTTRVGVIEVVQVLGRSSICKIIEGKPDAKDLLEPM